MTVSSGSNPFYITGGFAADKVLRAVKSGELIRAKYCEHCGEMGLHRPCGGKFHRWSLSAHHDDYTSPLSVLWLCNSCHRLRHSNLRRAGADPRRVYAKKILDDGGSLPSWFVSRLQLEASR